MAVLNKSVDQIVELEKTRKNARTFMDYMKIAQHIFDLRKALFNEFAEVYNLAPPSGIAVS